MKKPINAIFRMFFLVLSVMFGFFLIRAWKNNKPNIKPQLEKIKERISERVLEQKQHKIIETRPPQKTNLNARQKVIYTILRSKKTVEMKDLLRAITGVTERTLRRDLLALQELGMVRKEGNTKSVKYHLISD